MATLRVEPIPAIAEPAPGRYQAHNWRQLRTWAIPDIPEHTLPTMLEDEPIYRADCPSRAILDQIADKWSMLVLAVLSRPHRFNAIKRRLEGITQRVLTQTLRKLERNGMVSRTVLSGRQLGVEYALTPMGRSLQEPFSSVYEWTVSHMDRIQKCQEDFDQEARQGEHR